MNKLKKPRDYEAGEPIVVNFQTQEVECANLKKSGLLIQTSVLVASNGEWHEIEIADLGLDSIHLPTFKYHIESNGLKLSDLGIVPAAVSYELTHDDFMSLDKEFGFSYVDIAKFHEYQKRTGDKLTGVYHKRQIFTMLVRDKKTIDQYISELEELKSTATYEEVVNTEKPQQAIIIDTVPVPVLQDGISITLFENLSPAKINELTLLRAEQEKIAKENPVITITDKKTYAQAKKTAAVLLSASTKVDGDKGIFANAKKLINTFKSAFDSAGVDIAKITRTPLDNQKKLIKDWDDRIAVEIKRRTDLLFSVPFSFDGTQYNIGSLMVTAKDLEDKTNIEFDGIITQGKAILVAIEEAKKTESETIATLRKVNEELAAQNAEIMKKLDALLNPVKKESEPEFLGVGDNGAEYAEIKTPSIENDYSVQEEAIKQVLSATLVPQDIFKPQSEVKAYKLPSPDNKLLNQLDLDHFSVLEETTYLQCREYYVQALKDVAKELQSIMQNPDRTIQKSVEIQKLIDIWQS